MTFSRKIVQIKKGRLCINIMIQLITLTFIKNGTVMIKNKQHIAFHSLKKTVEWYYNNNGKSHALEYYKNLSREQQNMPLSCNQIDSSAFSLLVEK